MTYFINEPAFCSPNAWPTSRHLCSHVTQELLKAYEIFRKFATRKSDVNVHQTVSWYEKLAQHPSVSLPQHLDLWKELFMPQNLCILFSLLCLFRIYCIRTEIYASFSKAEDRIMTLPQSDTLNLK